MSRQSPNQAKIKIQSPTYELTLEILEILEKNLLCVTSPIMDSDRGGYHVIVDVRSVKE